MTLKRLFELLASWRNPERKSLVKIAKPRSKVPPSSRGRVGIEPLETRIAPASVVVPTLSIDSVKLAEGDSGQTIFHFTVSLSAPATKDVKVDYITADGTASGSSTPGSGDYDTIAKTTLTIPAGATSAGIDVTVNGDTTLEQNETFTIQLSNAINATLDTKNATGTGTILNDDAPQIAIVNTFTNEGDSGTNPNEMTFTVQLSGPTTHEVTVDWATSDGTAFAGADYTASFGTLHIAAGDTKGTFTVPVIGNLHIQADRKFAVDLSNATNGSIFTAHGTGTILDDDTPNVTIGNITVVEGNDGTSNAVFTVTLSKAIADDVSVDWSTADGTAHSGTDYIASSGTLQIPGGQGLTSATVSVPIIGNTLAEANKTFVVNLSNPSNSQLANTQASGTILNDDAPAMTISDVSVVEGHTGTKDAVFTVTLAQTMATDVSVNWSTADGTATSLGDSPDYKAASGTLVIPAGSLTGTISVAINGDTIKESNETFSLNIGSVTGAKPTRDHAVGTIIDDDGGTVVDPHTLAYTDVDGDLVTIKTTKGTFGADPNQYLSLVETSDGCYQLNSLSLPSTFQGTDITFSAKPAPGGGDSHVNVGVIDATGVDLGKVVVPGDLGKILAGDSLSTTALVSLQVDSLGAKGTSTGASNLASSIQGPVGMLKVLGNVDQATFSVTGVTGKSAAGNIGSISIGGALIGGAADGSGKISFTGTLGTAEIGSIQGGSGAGSGMIFGDSSFSKGIISKITVDGDLLGGAGAKSGQISAGSIANATIGGDIQGGAGSDSGELHGEFNIGSVFVQGSIHGGGGAKSGSIQSFHTTQATQTAPATTTIGDIKQITLGVDLVGGAGASSGLVYGRTLGTVAIHGHLQGGDGSDSGEVKATTLASATVGVESSSLDGATILGGKGANSGSLVSLGNMGTVKILGNLQGGEGDDSGQIRSSGSLASVTIQGTLQGGTGLESGSIQSSLAMGMAKITGNIQGGAGDYSGEVFSATNLGTVSVLGSVLGGDGEFSGLITSSTNIGTIKIAHDLVGGAQFGAGSIYSNGKIATVTISGSLEGRGGENSGSIFSGADPGLAGDMGQVIIGAGIQGGDGANSGQINAGGNLVKLIVNGNLQGSSGVGSGSIVSFGSLGAIQVTGEVQGGSGSDSGAISSGFKIGSVTIGGSLWGSSGQGSGSISSHTVFGADADLQGDIGAISVSGGVIGGSGSSSGQINAAGALAKVTIGDSLLGGSGNGSGSILSGTDAVTSGAIGTISIGANLEGGNVSGSNSLDQSGYIAGQQIAKITIGGSVVAGTNDGTGSLTKSGSIRAEDSIGILQVKGRLVGNSANPVVISARGQAVKGASSDLAIASLTVGASVEYANILAGYDTDLNPVNGDGQIGAIKVLNNAFNGVKPAIAWKASSVVAGVYDAGHDGFGSADNAKITAGDTPGILSKIASIQIAGEIAGNGTAGDHFGFVAQQIGSFKLGTTTVPLQAGGPPDVIDPLVGNASDVSLREIAS